MRSKSLFVIGYILLFLSMGLTLLVFVGVQETVFTVAKGAQPSIQLVILDSTPTVVFLIGIGFLVTGQIKQRSEKSEED